jgi:hypothetical protein
MRLHHPASEKPSSFCMRRAGKGRSQDRDSAGVPVRLSRCSDDGVEQGKQHPRVTGIEILAWQPANSSARRGLKFG